MKIFETVICKDCMSGRHHLIHKDCDCICHDNPQCLLCDLVLTDETEIKSGIHGRCEYAANIADEERQHHELPNRYPWEQ